MHHFLEMANQGQHRQSGFDDHTIIPLTALAQAQMVGMPILFAKPNIGKDHGFSCQVVHYLLKRRTIMDVGGVTIPVNDQAQLVLQQTQLTTDDPAAIGFALASDLLRTTPFTSRMNQLDAIGINHAQRSRLGHKTIDPSAMGIEQTKQTGPMRQLGEQGQVVPLQPAIEGTITTAFERKQQGQGHDLAWIQGRLRVFLRIGPTSPHDKTIL